MITLRVMLMLYSVNAVISGYRQGEGNYFIKVSAQKPLAGVALKLTGRKEATIIMQNSVIFIGKT